MKLLFLLVFMWTSILADHLSWQGDYEKARIQAAEEGKGLLVLLVKPACKSSSKILSTTFQNQWYISYLNKHYIGVLITKDQRSSYPIELLYTTQYPALFFLDAKEQFTHRLISGMVTPEIFIKHLELSK